MENYSAIREKAGKWLNSKRDFSEGVAILESAGFKPGVIGVLKRQGVNGPDAMERLVYHMRTFMKVWFDSTLGEDTDVKLGVVQGKEVAAVANSEDILSEEQKENLPEDVGQIVREYRESYMRRDILFRRMQDLPEDNSPHTVAERKKLSDMIEHETNFQDRIYPRYRAWLETGSLPPAEEPVQAEKPKRNMQEPLVNNLEALDKRKLRKLRKSISTKIGRAKNMLDFQTETKQAELNPMPDGVARIKYQSKIARLTELLAKIDVEIAKRA